MGNPIARRSGRRRVWLKRLDWAFFAIWAMFPVMVWLAERANTNFAALAEGLPPDEAKCLAILPNPLTMSLSGKVLFWGLFLFELSIYPVLLAILHGMVRACARGNMFIADTFARLRLMAILLIVYPVSDMALTNFVAYALHRIGDLPAWALNPTVDIGPIVMGAFLLALRLVLERAVELQSEADLTI